MKKILVAVCAVLLFFSSQANAQNFVEPDTLKQWLETRRSVILIDLQPAGAFRQRHIRGSVMTNAYSVETSEQKKMLDSTLKRINESDSSVVIVHAPGKMGRIGAGNAYDYFISKGVAQNRLFVLNGGIDNWPYENLTEKSRK
ncbi:MAG TPA: rhodanese-like domain-containing protein [Thermodesulfovibrionales bacterium]|nr:rhodanese-like domain-containing protein [Thermodesulfovibrionales bacterium]